MISIRNFLKIIKQFWTSNELLSGNNYLYEFYYLVKKTFRQKLIYFLLPLIIKFFPNYLYCFIGSNKKKFRYLPNFKERILKTNNFLNDFVFNDFGFGKFSEVNLIMRGKSFNNSNINKELPTFFINPTNVEIIKGYKNYWIVTSDYNILARNLGLSGNLNYIFEKDKHRICFLISDTNLSNTLLDDQAMNKSNLVKDEIKKLISKGKKINSLNFELLGGVSNKFGLNQFQTGSGLCSLISLLNISDKVNVYGWDQYLDKKPLSNFLGQIKCLYDKKSTTGRIATNIVNCHYMHRAIRENKLNIKIEGYLKYIALSGWVPIKLSPIFYKQLD